MKVLLIALSVFVSIGFGVAQAADRNAAYNAICKPMTFESDRASCMAKVKMYNYFDDKGLAFCKALIFDNDKVRCMEIIGDKMYEKFEMDNCMGKVFESEKLQCLEENGTVYNPSKGCVELEDMITQLNSGIKDMRLGNLKAADQRLSFLLNRLIDCRSR